MLVTLGAGDFVVLVTGEVRWCVRCAGDFVAVVISFVCCAGDFVALVRFAGAFVVLVISLRW